MNKCANPIGHQEGYLEAAGQILICHPNLVVKINEVNREELGKLVHHVFLCICRLVTKKISINAFSQQLENGQGERESPRFAINVFLLS